MKSLLKILTVLCCICLLNTCEDTKQSGDKPSPIVQYEVTPIPGGATIAYIIPDDPSILYVMAEYERNGQTFVERSSTHKNSLTIVGFNTLDPVDVTIFSVSRNSEIKSDPLDLKFTPLESPIKLIRKSAEVKSHFGGIIVVWNNPTKTEVGVRLMVKEEGINVEKAMYFSTSESERRPFRGFECEEASFSLTFEDKWGNISDTLFFKGIPLFEIEVEKPWVDMRQMIPHDNTTEHSAPYAFTKLYDGSIGWLQSYLTQYGSSGSSFTVDIKEVVKLSRFAWWPLCDYRWGVFEGVYGQVVPHVVEMWGTKAIDPSKLANRDYWLDDFSAPKGTVIPDITFKDDWVYLGRHQIERLDLKGATEDEIRAQGEAGFEFEIDDQCEPVRFIRVFVRSNAEGSPPPNNYYQINEMSFWGDNTGPQD